MIMLDVSNIATQANTTCATALQLVSDTNALISGGASGNGVVFTQRHGDMIIEKAFLDVFETLESFMENVFICYMLGLNGQNGNTVERYVMPLDKEHAKKILRGKDQYVDFTNRSSIMKYAENFFKNGGPFVYLNGISQDFEDMKKIRNEISHSSINSRDEFERMVRSRISFLPTSINVASFLMAEMPKRKKSFFAHYLSVVENTIEALSNP